MHFPSALESPFVPVLCGEVGKGAAEARLRWPGGWGLFVLSMFRSFGVSQFANLRTLAVVATLRLLPSLHGALQAPLPEFA